MPELVIRLGRVPDRLPDLIYEGPLIQVARDGRCRFAVQDIAAYQIDAAGSEVVIEAAVDSEISDVGVFLLGTVFGLLCHKRGLLPLHASCVGLGKQAVAFVGNSGIGKSTLAAGFWIRGHVILCDDVTVVDLKAESGPMVWPTFPRLKLWRDVIGGFGVPPDSLVRTRKLLEKYHLPIENTFHKQPLPLKATYDLRPATEARHKGISPLRGASAFCRLTEAVYPLRTGSRLLGRDAIFSAVARLSATVPAYALAYQPTLEELNLVVAQIQQIHGEQ
jgi:hypothetical protein